MKALAVHIDNADDNFLVLEGEGNKLSTPAALLIFSLDSSSLDFWPISTNVFQSPVVMTSKMQESRKNPAKWLQRFLAVSYDTRALLECGGGGVAGNSARVSVSGHAALHSSMWKSRDVWP